MNKRVLELYPSGRIKESFYVDEKGRKQDYFEMYYDTYSSPIMKQGYYTDGKLCGPFKTYHQNGARRLMTHFYHGKYLMNAYTWNQYGMLKDIVQIN